MGLKFVRLTITSLHELYKLPTDAKLVACNMDGKTDEVWVVLESNDFPVPVHHPEAVTEL